LHHAWRGQAGDRKPFHNKCLSCARCESPVPCGPHGDAPRLREAVSDKKSIVSVFAVCLRCLLPLWAYTSTILSLNPFPEH
jgi:hypothetical protein